MLKYRVTRFLAAVVFLLVSAISWAAPVNINTASIDELSTLKGIGPSKAEQIVRYRTEHGSFSSIEQLLEVKGIGRATLSKNQDNLTVELVSTKKSAD